MTYYSAESFFMLRDTITHAQAILHLINRTINVMDHLCKQFTILQCPSGYGAEI